MCLQTLARTHTCTMNENFPFNLSCSFKCIFWDFGYRWEEKRKNVIRAHFYAKVYEKCRNSIRWYSKCYCYPPSEENYLWMLEESKTNSVNQYLSVRKKNWTLQSNVLGFCHWGHPNVHCTICACMHAYHILNIILANVTNFRPRYFKSHLFWL